MKFFGHADLLQNQLQNAALETLTYFPDVPVVGQVAFVNSIVYICVQSGSLPIWVPLTREITGYTHTQTTASATWTITHGLNTTAVNVQAFDTGNRTFIPDEVEILNSNQVQVSFSTPINGKAVVITGHFDGNVKPTYSYTHFQSVASTDWVIVHNLGYNPITRVFIGNQEVQPAAITHDSTSQTTITFTTPQVGHARMI